MASPTASVEHPRVGDVTVRALARFGVALSSAALVVQLVFVALAVDLVVRRDQPADLLPLHLALFAVTAVLLLVMRWMAGRMEAATHHRSAAKAH